jgi:hypothetical protein
MLSQVLIYVYINVCIHKDMYIIKHMYLNVCICMYIYMCIIYVPLSRPVNAVSGTFIYIYIYILIITRLCKHLYTCIYMYICHLHLDMPKGCW